MGLFLRRRRPLMRLAAGAAVGGVAYHAGQRHEEQDMANDQAQDAERSAATRPYRRATRSGPGGGSDE